MNIGPDSHGFRLISARRVQGYDQIRIFSHWQAFPEFLTRNTRGPSCLPVPEIPVVNFEISTSNFTRNQLYSQLATILQQS